MVKKEKIIYYNDPLNDDFSQTSIKVKPVDENYQYINESKLYRFKSWILRNFIAFPILSFMSIFIYHVKVKNKKVLKHVKKSGYFLYANHTQHADCVFHTVLINAFKYTCVISSQDAFSINGFMSSFIRLLGAIPVPRTPRMYKNYLKCMEWHIKHKHKILIYPEKHIWPYYNKIRDFTNDTFRYPVMFNCPIISATTCYKKSKIFKKPKMIIYLDGPFYPDASLDYKNQFLELRNKTLLAMKNRSKVDWNYEYIKYIKKEENKDLNL